VAARELLWRGARWSGIELVKRGIAARAVPAAELAREAHALCGELSQLPAASRTRLKRASALLGRERLESALEFEAECCITAALDADVRVALGQRWQAPGVDRKPTN
jgi:enoyl-CoA hydratase/carnithine racemase